MLPDRPRKLAPSGLEKQAAAYFPVGTSSSKLIDSPASSYPAPNFMIFLINILYPLYILCCFVSVYCVCRPKLVVNICINWLPIIINFSVILGSQCSPILFLFLIMYLFN